LSDDISKAEALLIADPHLVESWAAGWALSRGTPPPVRTAGALRIDVGLPQHRTRYIFAECSEDVRRLADTIHDPFVFIKVCASPESVQQQLPSHWATERLGFMMTQLPAQTPEQPALVDGYLVEVQMSPPVLVVQVSDSSGLVAAKGRAALVNQFAVYDQIETHEAHRRRGLGKAVMHALRETALSHGVDRGLLVATPDGRALYTTLGWQLHSLYTTAHIPENPNTRGQGRVSRTFPI
jgi:GNAT superfamily N-acetyltransferase